MDVKMNGCKIKNSSVRPCCDGWQEQRNQQHVRRMRRFGIRVAQLLCALLLGARGGVRGHAVHRRVLAGRARGDVLHQRIALARGALVAESAREAVGVLADAAAVARRARGRAAVLAVDALGVSTAVERARVGRLA